jgi:hypothetical protein
MEGWEEHQEIHREVNGLLEFTNEIQKQLGADPLIPLEIQGLEVNRGLSRGLFKFS